MLTCYADRSDVFDDRAVETARTLGHLAVLAIEATLGEDKADNLQMALLRSRTIGAAIGMLMERHQINADEALTLLGRVSQYTNIKLVEVAADLVDTGTLPTLRGSAQSGLSTPSPPVLRRKDVARARVWFASRRGLSGSTMEPTHI